MRENPSKILTESIVRKTIQNIKDSPERSTRNAIDLGLQVSQGRFQQRFFAILQDMLKNERSAYYGLVRDVVNHVNTERLVTFGMNVGYNSCTAGANLIRANEEKLGCNIPWTILLQIDGASFPAHRERYQEAVEEGRALGVYSWMLMVKSQPMEVLPLIERYPDCAFFLCCDAGDVTQAFLDALAGCRHAMPVIRYDSAASEVCKRLRDMEMLYSVYSIYSEADADAIANGDLFCEMEQLHPVFSILMAGPDCGAGLRARAASAVEQARKEQLYQTVLWELDSDNRMVDQIISEGACAGYFNPEGFLKAYDGAAVPEANLFTDSLREIFQRAFAKA